MQISPHIDRPLTAEELEIIEFQLWMDRIAERERRRKEGRHPHQVAPSGNEWIMWGIQGGRGSGKSDGMFCFCLDELRRWGSAMRLAVGAPTIPDARDKCAEGPSGLISMAPEEFDYNRSLLEARHYKGGYIKFMGSEEPDRWNGGNWTHVAWDELALVVHESYIQSKFALRLSPTPQYSEGDPRRVPSRMLWASTPKGRKFVKEIVDSSTLYVPDSKIVVTRGKMNDNRRNLSEIVIDALMKEYPPGSRLYRQEILGEFIEDENDALWTLDLIDSTRKPMDYRECRRVVVAVDPASGSKQTKKLSKRNLTAETGIAVCGLGPDGEGYLLHSEGHRAKPEVWAKAAWELFDQYAADKIVGERNHGGDMVESTIMAARPGAEGVYADVTATRGKWLRAEPIATRYANGTIHHTRIFDVLEGQMCSFRNVEEQEDLIDRLDAMVWGFTEIFALSEVPVNRSYTHAELRVQLEQQKANKKKMESKAA